MSNVYACLMSNVYAADSPQCGRNDGHFVVIQQSDETSDNPRIDHFLDSFIGSVGEIRKCPAGVGQDLFVVVVDEVGESRKELSDCRDGWRRFLVAAQVGQCPRNITQECGLKLNDNLVTEMNQMM